MAGPPLALPNFEAFQIQAEIVRLTFDRATHAAMHALEKALEEDFEKPKHDAHNVWSLHPTAGDHVNTEWLKAQDAPPWIAPTATPDRAGIAPAAGAAAAAALAIAAPALLPVIGPFGGAIAAVGAAVDVAAKLATYFREARFQHRHRDLPAGADDQLLATCVAHAVTSHHHHHRRACAGPVERLAPPRRPGRFAGAFDRSVAETGRLGGRGAPQGQPAHCRQSQGPGAANTANPTRHAANAARNAVRANAIANIGRQCPRQSRQCRGGGARLLHRRRKRLRRALVGSLAAAGKDGMPAASAVLQEKAIADFLAEGGHVLWVKVSSVVSSSYTKKSWWPTLNIHLLCRQRRGGGIPALTRGARAAPCSRPAPSPSRANSFRSMNWWTRTGKEPRSFPGAVRKSGGENPHMTGS